MRRALLTLFILLTSSVAAAPVTAVLFYSNRCPHCHEVMKTVLPPLLEAYRTQFEVVFVNVSSPLGSELYYEAIDALEISDDRMGVPTLMIGEDLLVGTDDIEEHLPALLHTDLEQGGVPLPAIPGLAEALVTAQPPAKKPPLTKRAPPITIATEADLKGIGKQNLWEKLSNDPIGNSLAIVMIALLIATLIWVPIRWKHGGVRHPDLHTPTSYWLPLLALGGVIISLYMTYIETREMPAICGPIGNCNAVQQSPWATLFGLIPVGLLGIAGYGVILIAWLWDLLSSRFPHWILPALLYSATLFSLYLTLLEPFVIGAACVWCLTSALITTLMLWSTVRHGLLAQSRNVPL